MKVSRSRSPRELIAVLGVGVEVTDWDSSGCKRGVLLILASSGAEGRMSLGRGGVLLTGGAGT